MSTYWASPPVSAEQIAAVGLWTWVLAAAAAVAGGSLARAVLVPAGAADETGRAQELATWRTLVGFGFVAGLSLPYRSLDASLDKAWGSFNVSIAVALITGVVLAAVFWVSLEGDPRDRLRSGAVDAGVRVGKFVVGLVALWAVLALCEAVGGPGNQLLGRIGLIALGGFFGYFALGCWCISRYWFGIGRAHPLLPPLIAAVTISVMTFLELHTGGPEALPLRLWILINVTAVLSTLGICFVEICDAVAGPGPAGAAPPSWPVATAATIVVAAVVGAGVLLASGTAERTLCAGPRPLVACSGLSGAELPYAQDGDLVPGLPG